MATSTLGSGTLVLAGTTSGTTTVTATAVAGTTTLTLPAATDTLVGKATTDTLTNKTLTGAAMNGTLGATTPSTASVTTLTTSSTVTHNGGTANGVAYLDGSKVLTTGSALVFDGTNLLVGTTTPVYNLSGRGLITINGSSAAALGFTAGAVDKGIILHTGTDMIMSNSVSGAITFQTNNTERARIESSGNFVQKGATTAAGIKPTAIANNESITTVNSTTYTITLSTSAKLFWISLGNGDGALVFTSYLSSSITFLGITPTNVAATASPSSAQLGISKSANSHDIVIKTGSALSSTAAAWQMGVLSSQVA